MLNKQISQLSLIGNRKQSCSSAPPHCQPTLSSPTGTTPIYHSYFLLHHQTTNKLSSADRVPERYKRMGQTFVANLIKTSRKVGQIKVRLTSKLLAPKLREYEIFTPAVHSRHVPYTV